MYSVTSHFRFVKPYEFVYSSYVKGRWVGRSLLDMLTKEFKFNDENYYKEAINLGNITIDNKIVGPLHILQNHQVLRHKKIRVENPVFNAKINIIFEDDNFIVLNKPPSIPVHSCSGYHFNTLTMLLKEEMNQPNLHCTFRLDKLTSGIMILAKNSKIANEFHLQLRNNQVHKVYLARVSGRFPYNEIEVDQPIFNVYSFGGQYRVAIHSHELIVSKKSLTKFKMRFYDKISDTSLLECYPLTGRTHQIRVHLKFLGYPVINDIDYGGNCVGNIFLKYMEPANQHFVKDGHFLKEMETIHNLQKIREIMLHSLTYQINGKEVTSDEPYWSVKNFELSSQDGTQHLPSANI